MRTCARCGRPVRYPGIHTCLRVVRPPQPACTHGVTFDLEAAERLERELGRSAILHDTVRKRWPRLCGKCPLGCGYEGTYYASAAHYVYGSW